MIATPLALEPGLYEGWVCHRRQTPKPHAFRFPLFMAYLDLADLPRLLPGRLVWTLERAGFVSFHRRDYLPPVTVPLETAVRDLVEQRLGTRPEGPIRLLTHLRTWGYGFNPVSFYYCFDRTAARIEAVVADITNTPWGERYAYVLSGDGDPARREWSRARFRKQFHVSPFMEMEIDYDWRFRSPGRTLLVRMVNEKAGVTMFDATLMLRRRPWTRGERRRALWRHPFMTGQVIATIYWNALRLWLRGVPYLGHTGDSAPHNVPGGEASR